ncbi:MAG: ATP-binding cassette domain-containing protein [Planctomycetaceae bacterium]
MTDVLWELHDVSLGRSPAWRLDRVSLTVRSGVTAVIGPSGSGKTSLLNLLTQFEGPDGGTVTARFPANGDRLPLAWAPPDFGLWPHLSVREHLESVQPPGGTAADVTTLLESLGLGELADANVGRLSQGERSRLAVVRALCSDPLVLVMDEPLVHVDPMSLDGYWRVIRDQCRRRETALVFSTHSPEVVLREAEHVVCLEQGRVSFDGSVAALYTEPPTPRLARFLGPANWFDAVEAERWVPHSPAPGERLCLRPEQIELAPADGDGFRVRTSRAIGALVESELEHDATHDIRTVVHRPGAEPLAAGSKVLLRLCVLLVMCLVWAGCQQSAAGPQLPVTASRTFKMPSDGSSVPAPRSLTVSPEGELYVLDNAGRVLVYTPDGMLNRQWHMPEYDVGKPEGVCILSDGTIAVADTHYHRIVVFDRRGEVLRMFGEFGEAPGQFIYPVAITRDNSGHVYVAEYGGNDRIQKFTERGDFVSAFGSFGTDEGQFQRPSGIVWVAGDAGGAVYIADAINNRVHVYSDNGEYRETIVDSARELSVEVDYPYDIALGPDESLFLVEYGAGRVTQITRDGELIGRYGGVGRGDGQFYTPWGIAVDPRGRVYVADTGNHRTVELSL